MRKKSRKGLIRECDGLWGKIIHARSGHKDELGGSAEGLQAHHWWKTKGAGGYALRWNLLNGVCVNAVNHNKADRSPGQFMLELIRAWGKEVVDEKEIKLLEARHSLKNCKWTDYDIHSVLIGLQAIYEKEMGAENG